MDIAEKLVELLTDDAGVAAAVGGRVYPVVLPQNPALPAIVYQEVRGSAKAAAGGDTGMRESRILISYYAASFSAIKVGKMLLTAALSGASAEGVSRIEVDGIRDDYDPETGWFRQLLEIMVFWTEE